MALDPAEILAAAPPCPLRTLTGIPCPLCGMTTASIAVLRGDVGAALAANPFLVALVALVGLGLGALVTRRIAPPGPRPVAVLASASWAFQLHRVGPL